MTRLLLRLLPPRLPLWLSLRGVLPALLASALASPAAADAAPPLRHLQPYADEAQLQEALQAWRAASEALRPARARPWAAGDAMAGSPVPALAQALGTASPAVAEMASAGAADGLTNVQTAGADEGGIVKQSGQHLVILRRGRLFTVRVGGDQLQPTAALDAFAPGADPRGTWIDELLVSGRTVVVIGYSVARGGTEIGLFDLAPDGALSHQATYLLRSADYYSSRNYASRLLPDGRLVFYTPLLLQAGGPPPVQFFPALRRWSEAGLSGVPAEFERLLPATRIYRTDDAFEPGQALALHTVTSCELGGARLQCESSAVLGPPGRVFHVSSGSVYVWTRSHARRWPVPWPTPQGLPSPQPAPAEPLSALFRLPLDGTAPSAIKTSGVPVDMLSFVERDHRLHVLLREAGDGEGMFAADSGRGGRAGGRLALLSLPLAALGDGRTAAPLQAYRRLPDPGAGELHNRHVGEWLLWGGARGAWAMRVPAPAGSRGSTPVQALHPGHAVERIEALGQHALLVGPAGAHLRLSTVRLGTGPARLVDRHELAHSRQGEARSHGFFYRATAPDAGVLGLPVLGHAAGGRHAPDTTSDAVQARIVFLRLQEGWLHAFGELHADPQSARQHDACRVSCVDWYGNARPLFLGERVLALLGYELVEGRRRALGPSASLVERRRVQFLSSAWPMPPASSGRPTPFD